ncbi:MAG: hypothetical protein C4525_13890 [Desulfarculus sp.]|nr:MAG: hypothetical protein C4525_13890 [Desulfarculus sp.]
MPYLRPLASLIIAGLLSLLLAGPAAARGPLAAWFDPTLGDLKANLKYRSEYAPQRGVEDQPADWGYWRQGLTWLAPVWQNPRQEMFLHGRVNYLRVDTEAVLPNSGRAFPKELWDLRLGGTYRRRTAGGWVLGGDFTVGSPSDRPFNSYDDTSINATVTLMTVQQKKHYWLFFVNYSNTRDFLADVPLPGAAYAYRPGPELQLLLGLPLASVRWRPAPRVNLRGLYVFPRTIITLAGYRLTSWLEAYTGFDWTYQRYFLHDRTDTKDRFFYYQKQIKLGLDFRLSKGLRLDLSGGYVFDRMWFEGNDWDDRDQDRINLENGFLWRLGLSWRF